MQATMMRPAMRINIQRRPDHCFAGRAFGRRGEQPRTDRPMTGPIRINWSEREDLNLRPLVSQTSALTGLRYAPTGRL